ncbi:uncharacterized protein TNCV_2255301 [Trichonephila clavipes]|nr:uncharacterized protein TNCV_2255301 [Trichonephila clavipes]
MRKQCKTWEKYYNRKRREVNIKVNGLVLVQTHFISAAGRRVTGNFMPKFEGPYSVLEVRNNNLTIWKKGRSVKVNIDHVRVYHPRHSDANSFDSTNETLYEGKGSSNGSSWSHPGKSSSSRKPSGDESKSRKSNRETAGLEDLRLKRNVGSNETAERNDIKRSKICRKRSFQGSEHGGQNRQAPVLPQGLKRSVPSSEASRIHKYWRQNLNPSKGPESISGPSNQQKIRQLSPPKEQNRRGARVQSDKARKTRTTRSKRHGEAERRTVRSGKTTTVRSCPYYLRSRLKEPEGILEEQRSTGIDSQSQNSLRRRSFSIEALDGDPADRSA